MRRNESSSRVSPGRSAGGRNVRDTWSRGGLGLRCHPARVDSRSGLQGTREFPALAVLTLDIEMVSNWEVWEHRTPGKQAKAR